MRRRGVAVAGVVLAGGSGTRFGAPGNKAYLPLAGRRIFTWSLNTLARLPEIKRLVLVVRAADHGLAASILDREVPDRDVELIAGGSTRHESEQNALRHLASAIASGEVGTVLIHDAARPLLSPTLARAVIGAAVTHGAAVPALPCDDLVEVTPGGEMTGADCGNLRRVQTPQAFAAGELLDAYEAAARDGFQGPDTASCVHRRPGRRVHWVLGDPRNVKITYPQDLFLAEHILAESQYRLT